MEAKVDVRKLQILNDRINQTIDALNQVRLSVHGLGHSGIQNPFLSQGYGMQQGPGLQNPYLFGMQNPLQGGGPLSQLQNQFAQQQGVQGLGGGLGFQHSPFTPQYTNPFVNPFTTQNVMSPWGQVPQTPFTGQQLGGLGGVAGGIGGGLFHSSPDIIDRQIAEVDESGAVCFEIEPGAQLRERVRAPLSSWQAGRSCRRGPGARGPRGRRGHRAGPAGRAAR